VAEQRPVKSPGKGRTPLLTEWFQHRDAAKPLWEPAWGRSSDYLASVTTGQKDQNSSWSNRGPQPPLVLAKGLFAVTQELARNIFSGVVPGLEKEEQTMVPLSIPQDRKLSRQFRFFLSSEIPFPSRPFWKISSCCNPHFRNTMTIFCTITQQQELSPRFLRMLPVQRSNTNSRGQPAPAS